MVGYDAIIGYSFISYTFKKINISFLSPAVWIQDKLWNFLLKAEGRKLLSKLIN